MNNNDTLATTVAAIKSLKNVSKMGITTVHNHLSPMLGKYATLNAGGAISLRLVGRLERVATSNLYTLRGKTVVTLTFSALDIVELGASTIVLKNLFTNS